MLIALIVIGSVVLLVSLGLTDSGRQMNWSGAKFTPSGGSATNILGVTDISIDKGGTVEKQSGDADRYNTIAVNSFNEPTITVQSNDLRVHGGSSLVIGTVGAFEATHNDSKNLAVSGSYAIKYSLANAVVESNSVSGQHKQFGKGSLKFTCFSSDGTTSPLTQTVL